MKFHWGHGIAIFFSIFVIFMLTLLFLSRQENIDLVSEDYYAEELKYGDRIEKIKNSQEAGLYIQTELKGDQLILSLPEKVDPSKLEGTVIFYRPSDAAMDLEHALDLDDENSMAVPLKEFHPGLYKVQLEFKLNDTSYFIEKNLNI
jgi:hypothetical protein